MGFVPNPIASLKMTELRCHSFFADSVLLGRGVSPVEIFAFEEAEVGYGVGDSQAFGVVIGIEADGLEPVGDGDFCGFDALRQLS
jgi:hypothetical protein